MSPFHHGVGRVLRHSRVLGAVFAVVIVAAGLSASVIESTPATAATVSFSQCNNQGAGINGAPLSVTCSIQVVNTIDASGGTSAAVYSRVCTLNACTGDTTSSSNVIDAVHQCNGSDNVGGSTTTCSVDIVNNISASAPGAPHAITVNQCIGSGGGGGTNMTACIPSSSGGATVTQCNGSGTGGGGQMTCTASGTTSDSFPVTVDQCNGSENGGGSFVVCSTSITTNVIDTSLGESGGPGGGTPGGGTPTDSGLDLTDTPLFGPGPPVAVETPPAGLTG
jgi:hypothetical protein